MLEVVEHTGYVDERTLIFPVTDSVKGPVQCTETGHGVSTAVGSNRSQDDPV